MAWTDYLIQTGSIAGYAIIMLLLVILMGLVGWFVFRLIKYNKICVVRVLTGGGTALITIDKAKEYKDKKTSAYMWRLKKRKHTLPRPPPKAICLTKKGKEWADLYYTGQGQYVPAITANPDFLKENEFIKSFQPITESQRMAYTDQMDKALTHRSKSFADLVRDAVPYLALVMIIAVFLLFLNEGMKPIIEQAQIAAAGSEDFKLAAEIMRDAIRQLSQQQVIGTSPINGSLIPD